MIIQSVRISQDRLLLNVDQAATVFYSPGSHLDVVMGALKLRSLNEYRDNDPKKLRELARAVNKI
jgi:hypothetical protein